MKKRYIGFILAAMMTAQPLAAQGAVNPSPNTKPVVTPSKDRDDSNASSKPLDKTGSEGTGITGAATESGGLVGGSTTGGTATGGNRRRRFSQQFHYSRKYGSPFCVQ